MLKKLASGPESDHVMVSFSGSVAVYVSTVLGLVSQKLGIAFPETTGPTLRLVSLTVTSVEGVPAPTAFRASTRTVYVLLVLRPVTAWEVVVTSASETWDATPQLPDANFHCTV